LDATTSPAQKRCKYTSSVSAPEDAKTHLTPKEVEAKEFANPQKFKQETFQKKYEVKNWLDKFL